VDSYSVYGPSKMLNPMAAAAAAGLFIIVMTARAAAAPRYGLVCE
jgi:hypothetical protein